MSIHFIDLNPFDLVFVLSSVAFNLLIAAIFIATKMKRRKVVRQLGILFLTLSLPLALVFVKYMIEGRPIWVMVYFGFILFYLLVEWLLDFVIKYDFRSKPITHIPYIILEYIALFGLIGITFYIDQTWGFVVSISFWILLGCLLYLYTGNGKSNESSVNNKISTP